MPFPKGGSVFQLSWKRIRARTVRQDWHAELPKEKLTVYDYAVAQAEPAYVMFSMTLDEAISLRRSGRHELARDQAEVSADFCTRFATTLECMLGVVERHANNFGTLPSVAPLDPLFFQGDTARNAAAINALLSNVLFRQHTRFLHKARTLGEIAADVAEEYRAMAIDESEGLATKQGWDHLSALQYDLTTSLREATVMLKSFIVSLPTTEVGAFRDRLATALLALQAAPAVTDRRATAYRRQ
jgi:hypothetical protein